MIEHLLRRGVIDTPEGVTCRPLGGGVSCDVYAVETPAGRLVVKRALEKLRVDADWSADRRRIVIEGNAIAAAAAIRPEAVPRIIDVDEAAYTLVMEHAPVDWTNWRDSLLVGTVDAPVAHRLGELLAAWHRDTRFDAEVLARFANSSLFEQLRIAPFHRATLCRHPDLEEQIEPVIDQLLGTSTCLVHGDFSPKNVVAGTGGLWVLDWEVAHAGAPDFDLAFLLAHLLAKSIHRPADSNAYRAAAHAFLNGYGASRTSPELIANVGCLLLARVDGRSPAPYLTQTERERARTLARALLVDPPADVLAAWRVPA